MRNRIEILRNIIKARNAILLEKAIRIFIDKTIEELMLRNDEWYSSVPAKVSEWGGISGYYDSKRIAYGFKILAMLHEDDWEGMLKLTNDFFWYALPKDR